MAFSNYKSISAVLKKFQIKYVQANFMLEIEFPLKDFFQEELDLLFTDGVTALPGSQKSKVKSQKSMFGRNDSSTAN